MTDHLPPPAETSAPPARALLQTTDWSRTPLGPLAAWPRTLAGYTQMVLDMPSPAIIFWGPEQTQIYNDGYAVIMGPRHPRHFGSTYAECWPDTYPMIYPWMRHVLDTGGTWTVERAHIPLTRHGFDEDAWFTFTFSPLRDDEGRVAGILQPVFEVTDAVLADRRAETLRLLVSDRQPLASPVDDALAAMAANEADIPFARLWLRDAEGARLAPAGTSGAALSAGDVQLLDAAAQAAWTADAATLVEHLPAIAAGLARGVLVLPLEAGAGGPPGGVVALGLSPRLHFDDKYRKFLDLVARQMALGLQRAEAALAAERQRQYLGELFMQAPAGIAVMSGPQHVFELVNPSYDEFTGFRQLLGKPIADAMPEMRDQPFLALLDEVYRTGVAHVGNESPAFLGRGPEGRVDEVFFNYVYQPLRDEVGVTNGILVFAYEVTEQVNARRRVEHLADELRDEHRRKDDFLAMLAHELRNPLAPIAAAAEVLRLGHAGDARLHRTSEIIRRQVRHLATLVDDLLDASRVTRGIVTIDRHPEDLRAIIAAAVEQVTPQMDAHRHRLRLPAGDAPAIVSGDRKRLVQVLTNLLDNAAKYTPAGGLVEVTLDVDAHEALLRVRDNGQGVPAELHGRIFDLFVQGQRGVDRAQGGLGVGLALARSLVELHGGALTCSSEGAGRGSEFCIRLPLAPAGERPAQAPAREEGLVGGDALSIFIVDDNVDASQMLAMLLESAGHAVLTESDPVVALDRIQAARPRVCLLDIGLPRMDGNELARRLRETPAGRAATLVALTGYGQGADREAAARAGFDHYMVKPPDTQALAALLRSVAAQGAGAPSA